MTLTHPGNACSTVNNLGTVRKLHNVLFPVSYAPGFYSALVDDRVRHPEDYCKLVFYQDLPVGVLVCRLEEADRVAPKTLSEAVAKEEQAAKTADDGAGGKKEVDDQKTYKLYVMTLGVLACVSRITFLADVSLRRIGREAGERRLPFGTKG